MPIAESHRHCFVILGLITNRAPKWLRGEVLENSNKNRNEKKLVEVEEHQRFRMVSLFKKIWNYIVNGKFFPMFSNHENIDNV